jgi:hypothetical protein
VFDKSGPSRKSGEARPDSREIEANSEFYLTKARADLDRLRRFCSRFRLFKHAHEIWKVHDSLDKRRRQIDEKYDYRYSVFSIVFATLIKQGWVAESDLEGLSQEKPETINRLAGL